MNWNKLPSGHLIELETVFHMYVVSLGRLWESDVCYSGSGCLYSKPSSEYHQCGPAASQILDSLCWSNPLGVQKQTSYFLFIILFNSLFSLPSHILALIFFKNHDGQTKLTQKQSNIEKDGFIFSI